MIRFLAVALVAKGLLLPATFGVVRSSSSACFLALGKNCWDSLKVFLACSIINPYFSFRRMSLVGKIRSNFPEFSLS